MARRRKRSAAYPQGLRPGAADALGHPYHRICLSRSSLGIQVNMGAWKGWLGVYLCPRDVLGDITTDLLGEWVMRKVRKLRPEERQEAATNQVKDPEFEASYPVMFEFMTSEIYEDGQPRKPSSMTVFTSDGLFKAVLKDPDNARSMWASGDNFEELLGTMELLLDSDDSVWRNERVAPGDKASRRKN
jgi:hypothetical protein